MRLFKPNTTFLQIMAGFVPVILLIFLVGYGVIYYQVRETVKTNIIENLKSISVRHASQIDSHVTNMMRDMESLLNHDQLVADILSLETVYKRSGLDSPEYTGVEEHIGHIFRDTIRIRKYYDLFVITPDGEIIYTVKKEQDLGTNLKTGPYKDSELSSLYQRVLSNMQVSISQFKYYEASKDIAGFIASPIISNKEIHGIMALQINTDKFMGIVQDYAGLQETGETVIAAKEGNEAIFITPLRFDPKAPMRTIPFGSLHGIPIQKAVQGEFGQGFSTDYRDKEILAVWSHLPSIDWGMVVKIDKSEAFLPVQKIQDDFKNISIVLVVLVLLIFGLLSKSISEEVSVPSKIPQQGKEEPLPSDKEKFRPSFAKKSSLRNKIIFSSLIPLVFVGILAISTYKTLQFSEETRQSVEHSYMVLKRALRIEKLMVDMETGERGFLITGEEQFLEPYNLAHKKIDSLIEETTDLVSDDPAQIKHLDKIKQLIDQWDNIAGAPLIELRRKVDAGEADFSKLTALIASEIGKKVFDQFRRKMEVFKGTEYSLLQERREKESRVVNLTKQIFIFGTLGIFFLSWLISYLLSKVIARPVSLLSQTAEIVSQGNLSARVQKITQDEIGVLSHSFNQMLDGLQNEMKARQQVQLELEKTTQQNELILNSAGEGIYGLDINGVAIFLNTSAEKLLGYEKEELLGKSLHELIHHTKSNGERLHVESCPLLSTLVDGVTNRSDNEVFWKKDGTAFPVECVSAPKFENGKVVGAVVVFKDITERKLAQQSQAYLASIIEGTDQGVIGKDLEGKIVSWNHGAEKIYDYSSGEIVGKKIHTIVPEDRYEEVDYFINQIRQDKKVDHYETIRVRKDGTLIDVLLTISPIRDINGQIVGASTFANDITEKKKTQKALEEAHDNLEQKSKELKEQLIINKTMTDNAASCLFMMDKQGHASFMNPAAEKVTGYTLDEIRGMPLHDAIHYRYPDGSPYPMSECPIDNAQADLVKMVDYEDVFVRKDGSLFPVICYIEPLAKEGEVVGAVLEFQDITERKRAEEEIKEKAEEMERFTYTVSHDLKSPLITIGGFLGFLQKDVKEGATEKIAEDIKHITGALRKMQNLLDELLELSRIGRLVNPPEVTSITEMATQACTLLEGLINNRGVEVEITPDMPDIKCDRPRIEEVLQNLIENAVKYMGDQPEPRITIGYEKEEKRTVYFVQDNGIGVDAKYKDRVFRIFEKLDLSVAGTGIGLSIVKRIIEVHGGTIWLESEGIGKGTTFYFTFPENIQLKE